MIGRKEDILKNLIIRSSRDNNGELIHKFLKKKTADFTDLQGLSELFELIVGVSLFVGAREYIRLLDLAKESPVHDGETLNKELQRIAQKIIHEKILESWDSNNIEKCSEAIIALYAIGDYETCVDFFKQSELPSKYVFEITEICFYDNELAMHMYDIILFVFDAAKHIDDFLCTKCIRAVRFNPKSAELFLEQKKADICRLAGWYFEHGQYVSLSSLMRIFEMETQNTLKYKSRVFEYIGIEEQEFLNRAFQNGSAKALDFYFIVKYHDEFPSLSEIEHILALKTSASVFCVVHQCLRRIKLDGYIDKNIQDILYYVKNNMKERTLSFAFYEDQVDRGIENNLLKRNIEIIFQMLCRNKQDVKGFLLMISYFNMFSNAELRLDYNITKDEIVKYSDWRLEYGYICERYEADRDVVYIVMNSYLRFFVDIEEFYLRYSHVLKDYWFPGLITNSRKVKLFQERYNRDFYKKKYFVEQTNLTKSPEELSYIRFKIKGIDVEEKVIYADEVQTIFSELSNVMSKVLHKTLQLEKITDAYFYLKSFEATRQNLNRHDRFIAVSKYRSPEADEIEELFMRNAKQYGEYLRYIYFNSYLKTVVSLNAVCDIIDSSDYLLGDITLEDNQNYINEAYYYISPNYYNPENIRYRIPKANISKEFNYFLRKQLDRYQNKGAAREENSRKHASVRICFYTDGQDSRSNLKNASKMYLHCCECEVKDISSALLTYYSRIYKVNRRGIASNIFKKYMNAYRHCARLNIEWFNEEWKNFFHIYFKYLHYEISSVNGNDGYLGWWVHNGCQYNINNIFVIMQDEMLCGLEFKEDVLKQLEQDKYYTYVLEDLKSCQQMQFFIYDKTVLNFMFDSYDDFREKIANL